MGKLYLSQQEHGFLEKRNLSQERWEGIIKPKPRKSDTAEAWMGVLFKSSDSQKGSDLAPFMFNTSYA